MNRKYDYEIKFIDKYDEKLMLDYIIKQKISNIDTLINILKDKISIICYIIEYIPGVYSIVSFIENNKYRIKIIVINSKWKNRISSENLLCNNSMYLELNDHIIAFFTEEAMGAYFANVD